MDRYPQRQVGISAVHRTDTGSGVRGGHGRAAGMLGVIELAPGPAEPGSVEQELAQPARNQSRWTCRFRDR